MAVVCVCESLGDRVIVIVTVFADGAPQLSPD